ncbi:MAG: DUF998 domain-containing protein [Vicinamibacterales bacterium]
MTRKLLLTCGIASSLLYVAMMVFIPMQWDAYSSGSQTISELSAIDAPTRSTWVPLGRLYAVLLVAFGAGVWLSTAGSRPLRIAAVALVVDGILSLFWPPMHLREVLAAGGSTLTDTMHLVFTAITVGLMLIAMSAGAVALGRGFRRYTVTTMIVLAVCGGLTGLGAPNVQANLPTPWIGVWERINLCSFLVWVMVLATLLMMQRRAQDERLANVA